MRKQPKSDHKTSRRITMPDRVDLSLYKSLDVSFTNGKGREVLNIQFRREGEDSVEFVLNVIGRDGDVTSAMTLFDLPV